jgi:catechol 2,3-dioxygenase-like lactoylglutathione lyase family enzyme
MPTPAPFVHHLGVYASDFVASEPIYTAALLTLGVEALYRSDAVAEYWIKDEDRLSRSLEQASRPETVTRRVHLAFAAPDRAAVDRFHDAAVEAGARSKHAPRYWPEYRAYCTFLRDPDGNNIEALHKEA